LDTEIGTGVLTHALMIFCPLTRKSPCEVFGTHNDPVSDIDTRVVDSPKVLDPDRPIREADIVCHFGNSG